MNNKVLLITGGSSDIGISLIKEVKNNYDYIIAHHTKDNENLSLLKQELKDKLILIKGNFKDEEETRVFIAKIKEEGKIPTAIVHLPAGSFENIKFPKIPWQKFETDFNISFRSLVLILQEFLPTMAKNKNGKIIVMLTSCTKNIPPKYLTSYVTSKYALLGLVKSLSNEYADKDIRINGISPSMIDTKFLDSIPELIREQNAMKSPTGKNLSVTDVIPTIKFLLSDGSDGITGENISITNGNI